MKIAVMGTGYVGLVAGAGFADFGNEVVCLDIDGSRIAGLSRGELPIYEPGLPELVRDNVNAGRLRFSDAPGDELPSAEVILICVGTPPGERGGADLSQVIAAAHTIAALRGPHFTLVAIKSTVPVGTGERVSAILQGGDASTGRAEPAGPFAVVSNPEFLKEGSAVEDFLRPMRILAGLAKVAGDAETQRQVSDRARELVRRLYGPVVRTNDRLLFCDSRSAELTKYASNAYLAMRVSFINDIANLCEEVGADVELVRRGMGMDTRIGPQFLFPGLGYGGSCFPKDTQALVALGRQHDLDLLLVDATSRINQRQRERLLAKLYRHFGVSPAGPGQPTEKPLSGKTLAIWGLSFKPETDDVREAPALALIDALIEAGARIQASDPVARQSAASACARHGDAVRLYDDEYGAASGADALILCTEWRQFRQPNFARLKRVMRGGALFDGRNIWDPAQVREQGLHYFGVGR
jgi:UDPglucose 6-dehydrogenase